MLTNTPAFHTYRQNTFLDRINNEFFRPHGLYCLVMTWEPDVQDMHYQIDVTSTIHQRIQPAQGMGKLKRSMKTSSGVGDVEFTECAALVFPALDELAVQEGGEAEKKRDKLKHYKGFAATYFDRRAQAQLVRSHSPFAPHPSFVDWHCRSDPT